MADFYAARRGLIPPLPWPTFSPPFSRFDAVKLSLDGLGMKTNAEGTRSANARSAGSTEPPETPPSRSGDGAEEAEIGTDVAGPATPLREPSAPTAGTAASGAGSVAIGGGANRAKIKPSVRKTAGEGA